MATLNPSNVVNGNTIQASDIEQLYNAFGTGSSGYTPITGLSLTGSITNANVATTATSASNITTAITGGGTHYLAFVQGAGTNPPKIDNLLALLMPQGKVLGNTVWINASYPEAFNITSSVNTTPPGITNLSILKVNVSSSGQVLISGAPSDTGTVIFTGIYI